METSEYSNGPPKFDLIPRLIKGGTKYHMVTGVQSDCLLQSINLNGQQRFQLCFDRCHRRDSKNLTYKKYQDFLICISSIPHNRQ